MTGVTTSVICHLVPQSDVTYTMSHMMSQTQCHQHNVTFAMRCHIQNVML